VLGDLRIAELSRLTHVWFKKALYYHQEVDVAGKLEGVRVNDGADPFPETLFGMRFAEHTFHTRLA